MKSQIIPRVLCLYDFLIWVKQNNLDINGKQVWENLESVK